MSTAAQVAANRANAEHSTGPRTEQGKARVALNPLIHGLSRAKMFLPGEAPEEFIEIQKEFSASFRCHSSAEAALVGEAALAWWKIRRIAEWQAAIIESGLNGPDMPEPLARLFGSSHEAALKILHRYETSAHGLLNRALNHLRLLQKQREADADAARHRRSAAATDAMFKYVNGSLPNTQAEDDAAFEKFLNGAKPNRTTPIRPVAPSER